jgi:hypothetical protein
VLSSRTSARVPSSMSFKREQRGKALAARRFSWGRTRRGLGVGQDLTARRSRPEPVQEAGQRHQIHGVGPVVGIEDAADCPFAARVHAVPAQALPHAGPYRGERQARPRDILGHTLTVAVAMF